MLERPLSGPNNNGDWRNSPRFASPEYDKYEKFLEAQALSEQASNKFVNFKDIIRPIERTQKKPVLEAMWNRISLVSKFNPVLSATATHDPPFFFFSNFNHIELQRGIRDGHRLALVEGHPCAATMAPALHHLFLTSHKIPGSRKKQKRK